MEVSLLRASIVSAMFFAALSVRAESGYDAWLRYAPVEGVSTPAVVTVLSPSPVVFSARDELIRGIRGMTGRVLRTASGMPTENSFVLTTLADVPPALRGNVTLKPDGYALRSYAGHVVVAGASERGVLYGTFALLQKIALGEKINGL